MSKVLEPYFGCVEVTWVKKKEAVGIYASSLKDFLTVKLYFHLTTPLATPIGITYCEMSKCHSEQETLVHSKQKCEGMVP